MTEVEFQEEMRKKISSLADDVFRLVKTDADILELIKQMLQVGAEESARRPSLLFQPLQQGSMPSDHEGDVVGGQTVVENILKMLLDHLREEKPFIQTLVKAILAKYGITV